MGHINSLWRIIEGLQEERPHPAMQEKLAMEALNNSANMVEHTFALPLKGKTEKIHKGEKEHAIFDDFQGMSLSESEIITMHSDKKV